MVARGEIGFLISSVAESKGIFRSASEPEPESAGASSELFLLVTWAIVLCTVVGPICVGLVVRRIKKLEKLRAGTGAGAAAGGDRGSRDVLGVWGLN